MTRRRSLIVLAVLFCVIATLRPGGAVPVPPPEAVLRDLANTPREARGTSIPLEQTTVTIALAGQPPRDALAETVLFLPEGWQERITSEGQVRLTLHFHGAPWFAMEEHARRGVRHPLLAFYLGEGSSMYQRPFEDPDRLPRVLDAATSEMVARGAPAGLRFAPIEVQSFSAGYGAVRELLKRDEWQERIERIVLADSLYASLTTVTLEAPAGDGGGTATEPRQLLLPDPDQMAPFVRFAERARTTPGRQFLLAHCEMEIRSYASTRRTADYLIGAMETRARCETASPLPMPPPGSPFGFKRQCSISGFHVWGYEGVDGKAHMAIARTIAEYWKALDADLPPGRRP